MAPKIRIKKGSGAGKASANKLEHYPSIEHECKLTQAVHTAEEFQNVLMGFGMQMV
jgi:hypothetical protein